MCAGGTCPVPFSALPSERVGRGSRPKSSGVASAGMLCWGGRQPVDQLRCCRGDAPAFVLANEAEPGSTGYVNTGFCLRRLRSLLLAQVLREGEDQL